MAVINVATSQNLSAITYLQDDTINVLDSVTLTIDSQWAIRPNLIQALGTGRIEVSNTSTTTPHLQQFYMQNGLNTGGFFVQQNGVLQVRGGWIIVGTSTGADNQVLFSSNNIGGVAIDYPSMIQVETGINTNQWEVWQAIPEDVSGGTVNTYGFNSPNSIAGTVAVTTSGVVTGIGTNFLSSHNGLPFKLPSIARDFVISAVTSTTSITIQELDGTTYTGGIITAGATYIIRNGSLINPAQVGISEVGKVLFFNPLTTAVRMGNDINGTKIPTGARVRIPNIHFNSALQQTTLATAITGTGAQVFTLANSIGATNNAAINSNQAIGSLLLVNGSAIERIHYLSRTGAVVNLASQVRGVYGTTAQASFPIGTLVYWIPSPSATLNNAGFSCNASGTIDIQICSVGMRFRNDFSNYADLKLKDFGCFIANIGSSAGTYDLNTLSVLGASWQAPTSFISTVTLNSMLGSGNIQNIYANNNYSGNTSSRTYNVVNIQNAIQIRNLYCRQWGRNAVTTTNAFQCFFLQTIKCAIPIEGLYMAGGGFVVAATTNIDIKNIFISSLPNGNSNSSADNTIFSTIGSTVNSTFRGLQVWTGGIVSRGTLISIDSSCENVVYHNKGYNSINGSQQTSNIVNDAGLNSIIAFISVTNPRINTAIQGYLSGNILTNRGGLFRMLLIDSVTATIANTGGASKSGVQLDMIAGPHRVFQTVATAAIIPNLVDVQPIVVLSNTAKNVGSVYVGGFSAQSSFNMYTFSGSAILDNLGRIYYPSIGDSVIIKSVFALKGITNFTGTAFDFNYNLGSGTNPIPAGTTVEFRMTNWGTANTGAWTAFTNNASLETARAALTGYSSSVGIDLQFRVTGTTDVVGRYIMSIKLPITIDATYNPPVFETQVGFSGAQTGTIIAGYINTDPNNPELQGSLILTGSLGSIPMPYNYDNTPVNYKLISRLAGWTFNEITDIYTKNAISIPITQRQIFDIDSNPLYTSAVTGVAVDHIAQTITVSASRSAKQIWSAVQDNLCLVENLTKEDSFVTDNGSLFISTYTLIINGQLTAGNIIGSIILTGTLADGVVITGNVTQNIPLNLLGIEHNGIWTYNTNTNKTITLTNSNLGTVQNLGTGIITINKINSTIANYVDAEINFIDSTISVIGGDSISFHPTANDRDLNINTSGTFSSSYAFKYGATINGSLMSGTLYLRCLAGGIPFNVNKTIVLGDNLVDLGTTAQLASISAKIELTAKETTLLQTETDIVAEINANEVKIDAIKAKTDTLVNTNLTGIALETTSQSIKSTVEALDNYDDTIITQKIDSKPSLAQIEASTILSKESTSQSIKSKVDTLNNYNDATTQTKLDAIKSKTDILVNTDLTLVAKEATLLQSETDIILEVNANEVKIDAVKNKVDTLNNYNDANLISKVDSKPSLANIENSTILAKETTVQNIKNKVDTLENTDLTGIARSSEILALNNLSASQVWAAASRTLTDKTGFALTTVEHNLIATAVEAHLINEADGQTIINAIVGAIGNSNVDQIALVAAIRADIERNGGMLDALENTNLTVVTEDLQEIKGGINDASLGIPTNLT